MEKDINKCICYHAEEHNAASIAMLEGVNSLVNLDLEYDAAWERFTLTVHNSSELELKHKINYCPICGRKLTEE